MVERAQWFKDSFANLEEELGKVLVGQHKVVRRFVDSSILSGQCAARRGSGFGQDIARSLFG